MALTISQALASSYPHVQAEKRRAVSQWSDSSFLNTLESMGGIKRVSFGPTLEEILDYQRNANAGFLATDLQATSLVKTEVITAASYTPGTLSVPIVWSKADEAKNPSDNQKIDFVASLLDNADETHDDLIEEALFTTSTDGFLGMETIIKDTDGQGTVGGINAATEAWWRNHFDSYASDGSDIEAALTEAYNTTSKGSGSKLGIKLLVSGAAAQAIYEANQQGLKQYVSSKEADAGFKVLAFKGAKWVFSQHGGTSIYGINPKSFCVKVSKDAFRAKGDTIEIPNANGYVVKIFSMLQTVTNNRSRLFVVKQA